MPKLPESAITVNAVIPSAHTNFTKALLSLVDHTPSLLFDSRDRRVTDEINCVLVRSKIIYA